MLDTQNIEELEAYALLKLFELVKRKIEEAKMNKQTLDLQALSYDVRSSLTSQDNKLLEGILSDPVKFENTINTINNLKEKLTPERYINEIENIKQKALNFMMDNNVLKGYEVLKERNESIVFVRENNGGINEIELYVDVKNKEVKITESDHTIDSNKVVTNTKELNKFSFENLREDHEMEVQHKERQYVRMEQEIEYEMER